MSEIQNEKDIENARSYLRGETSLESLTEDQVSIAFELSTSETENQSDTETEDYFGNNSEEREDIEETTSENVVKKQEIPEELDINKRIKEAIEEANRYKQLYSDREKKLESLKKDVSYRKKFFGEDTEPVVKINPDKDYLADEHLAKVDYHDSKIKDIEKLQSDFPLLKTSENFKSIDSKIIDFGEVARLAGVNLSKYLSDKSYRDSEIKKGYKLNISEKDMAIASKIYGVYNQYRSEVDQGYKTSISRVFKDSPDFERIVKSKYTLDNNSDDDVVRVLEGNSKEVRIMEPSQTRGGDLSFNVDNIIKEMDIISRKTNPTANDDKRYMELEKMLENYI